MIHMAAMAQVSEPPGVSGLDGTWKLGPIDLAAGMLGSGGGTAEPLCGNRLCSYTPTLMVATQ